ncbi:MAG: hypothetical protein K6B28_03300 [Lachnospiraceae bacterium]|nr:hypothetical protein [Lachnospiraceae bacterium]
MGNEKNGNEKPVKKGKKALVIILVIVGIIVLALAGLFVWGIVEGIKEGYEEGYEDDGYYEENDGGQKTAAIKESNSEGKEKNPGQSASEEQGSDRKWTIMVYLCGSDLETKYYAGSDNIIEMMNAMTDDNVNIVIQTGGSKEWHLEEMLSEDDKSDKITSDVLGFYHIDDMDLVMDKSEPLASMGESDTLYDFISWSKDTYPADKYGLIFWNHGGGAEGGVCFDELFEDDPLTLKEIKEAVIKADVPFEVIGFDACLMSSLETAEALQGYAHYMVASEEIEPGDGWDYTSFLNYLENNPGINGLEFGKKIADSYMAKCESLETDDLATISVTDLTKIPELSLAYKGYSTDLVYCTRNPEEFRNLTQGALRAENYGGNNDSEGYANMVDIGDLIDKTGSIASTNASNVLGALSEAVKYNLHGSKRENANGLSVFYPLEKGFDLSEVYSDFSDNTIFLEYIKILEGNFDTYEWEQEWAKAWEEAYANPTLSEGKYDSYFNSEDEQSGSGQQSGEGQQTQSGTYIPEFDQDYYDSLASVKPVSEGDYEIGFTQSYTDDGYLQLKVTSGLEILQNVSFDIYYEDPESEGYLYLGSDNDIYADYDEGIFEDNFSGTWITIGDQFVYAELVDQNENYNIYTIPILLNGNETNIRAVYDYQKEAFKVIGLNNGIDEESGIAGKTKETLKSGDKITFLFVAYDPNTDEEEMLPLGDITWSDNIEMADSELPDGIYPYVFKVEDIFGNIYYSDFVYMEVSDGDIYSYEE